MEKLTIDTFKRMIEQAAQEITARADEFSQLDAILGDGDHGEAISTAFQVIAKSSGNGQDFKAMLGDMGFGVMLETSGSTSTLLGGFLLGMSDAVPAATAIDGEQLKAMFRGGLDGVIKNTKAKRGDKTMMDALIPAVESMESSSSNDVQELLKTAAQAAAKGVEETIPLKANFGRARNLGDKTIGHPDAGATSWACMFQSFATTVS